jgi:hypothetical protein
MEEYWVTFRIESNAGYEKRYKALLDGMISARGKNASWGEPTSFWLVRTPLAIDQFMAKLTSGLDAKTDLVVCRCLAKDNSRYFGSVQHLDILMDFLPNVKNA